MENNHYQVSLPKIEGRTVKSNYKVADKRLDYLTQKLEKQPDLLERYHQEIESLEKEKFISRVTENGNEDGVFYLPHRGILKEQRETTKLRVVFDGSAKDWTGKSLNSCFYSGPCLNPELLKVLLNFRLNKYVLVGDITKAFLQIYISDMDKKNSVDFCGEIETDNKSSLNGIAYYSDSVVVPFC